MSDTLYYIICAVLTACVLAGIALMGRVRTAAWGNLLSALSIALAIAVTLYRSQLVSAAGLWICLTLAAGSGAWAAWRVSMIQMPQFVALLNGLGGAASALVAAAALPDSGIDRFAATAAALALVVGALTLLGSLVAAGKLHRLLPQKPLVLRRHRGWLAVSALISAVAVVLVPFDLLPAGWIAAAAVLSAAAFGVLFALRIGGADMPITISLLNALSGVAGAIAGMAIDDPLLVAVGGIVGASGLLLTQIMCAAMNRSLPDILLGRTAVASPAAAVMASSSIGDSQTGDSQTGTKNPVETAVIRPDPATALRSAQNVIIVPGYGMALAQAQASVKQLADRLEARGALVRYAIHPVAGRMPGHMNVLLCEVDVPYDQLYEMDAINGDFATCDLVIIVGANDVVNPAARFAEGTPIYGMPVLAADQAPAVIICNFDDKPGYAGVPNPLYDSERTILLPGDAKDTLEALLSLI